MRRILLFATLLIVCCHVHAKVVYLDNTKDKDASQNLFNTFSDAYTACTSDGDTIYVMGSTENYGDITISKPITIIGPGYFLSENSETQLYKLAASFDAIILSSGSAGTTLQSIKNSYDLNTYMLIQDSDITVENCYISRYIEFGRKDGSNFSNITITKCYFAHSSSDNLCKYKSSYSYLLFNCNISNNIFSYGLYIPDGSTGIINGNLIAEKLSVGESSTFEIHNNILLAETTTNLVIPSLPDVSISHNISVVDLFGTDNDNQSLVSEDDLFVGSDDNSTDGQYQLASNSPAAAAGQEGIDIGPFGGADPYRLSGLPNLPNIYELSTGGFVTGNEMKVHIKAKQ